MNSFQALRSPAIPLTSFHDLPVFLISSSIVLCHVLFGLPLLLYPWGFQSNAVFSIAPASLHNVCPIQFHFLLFIWISIGFCLVILHSSSFVILSVHFIFIICLKHLFTNVCNLLVIWLVVFQVSHPYNNTDFTFVLHIRILTPFDILWFLHNSCCVVSTIISHYWGCGFQSQPEYWLCWGRQPITCHSRFSHILHNSLLINILHSKLNMCRWKASLNKEITHQQQVTFN